MDPVWIQTKSMPALLWIDSGSRLNPEPNTSGSDLDLDKIHPHIPLVFVWIQTKYGFDPNILSPDLVWIQTKSTPISVWIRSASRPNPEPYASKTVLDPDQLQTTAALDPVRIETKSRSRAVWIRSGSRPNPDREPSGSGLDPD